MAQTWDQKLSDKARLGAIFDDLTKRGSKEPRFLYSSAVYPELTLHWVLSHRSQVLKTIARACESADYNLDVVKHSVVVLDKQRDFYIAAWPERIMLMNMARILAEETNHLVSNSVYSFRAGRGTTTAMTDLSHYLSAMDSRGIREFYVLKRDVTKYGDSIPHDKLIHYLMRRTKAGENQIFMRLLAQSLCTHYRDSNGVESCMVKGVPSGSPLVPPLENLYLTPLDDMLRARPDTFYGRYGDDFLFVTPNIQEANAAKLEIDQMVADLGLAIKPEKKQDIYLTLKTSPKIPEVDGYQTLSAFEWLGARMDAKGRRGMRQKHQKSLWSVLRNEVRELIVTSAKLTSSREVQIAIVRAGILKLVSKKDSHQVSALLFGHTSATALKQFDHLFTAFLRRSLESHWNLGRRESWKVLKSLKIPKAFFEQYMSQGTPKTAASAGKPATTRRAA